MLCTAAAVLGLTIRWVGGAHCCALLCVSCDPQIGLQSFRDNVILELFNQIVREPCFNVLRTKEQLGN